MMRPKRQIMLLKVCVLPGILFLLAACSKNSAIENTLVEMNERLVSYTEIENSLALNLAELEPPARSALRLDIENVSINLREFYALNQCNLAKLIAERNTALGKTQLPSIRFAYEHRLLDELYTCERQLDDAHRMKAKLGEWLVTKQKNLPRVYANLITQSKETNIAFTLPSGYISGTESDNFLETKMAIDALTTSPESYGFDVKNLEHHLRVLEKARLIANMWNTQNLLIEALPQITSVLKAYQLKNNCATASQREELRVMQNIYKIFFAEKVQPIVSQLNKYHYQISPSLIELAQMPALPENFVDYIKRHNVEQHQQYRTVLSDHISEWQKVFNMCT